MRGRESEGRKERQKGWIMMNEGRKGRKDGITVQFYEEKIAWRVRQKSEGRKAWQQRWRMKKNR